MEHLINIVCVRYSDRVFDNIPCTGTYQQLHLQPLHPHGIGLRSRNHPATSRRGQELAFAPEGKNTMVTKYKHTGG